MRILVAEDEIDILEVYNHALKERGHEVYTTVNGEQCLKIYEKALYDLEKKPRARLVNQLSSKTELTSRSQAQEHGSIYASPQAPFDVVVLDYKMPKKDGLQTASEILNLVPRQRIVFASAYVKETLENSVKGLRQVVELLQKPFTVEVLVETIEDREPYEAIKNLMIDIQQQSRDLSNPNAESIKYIFDNLRRIQKGRVW